MTLVSLCNKESVRDAYFRGRSVQLWTRRENGSYSSRGNTDDTEYHLNVYGPVSAWVIDVYSTKTRTYVDDMGCPLGLCIGTSPVGVYHGEIDDFCKIVELKQRVARFRSLCLLIGRISLYMKQWYDEISFRPNHSGAAASKASFVHLAASAQRSTERWVNHASHITNQPILNQMFPDVASDTAS